MQATRNKFAHALHTSAESLDLAHDSVVNFGVDDLQCVHELVHNDPRLGLIFAGYRLQKITVSVFYRLRGRGKSVCNRSRGNCRPKLWVRKGA